LGESRQEKSLHAKRLKTEQKAAKIAERFVDEKGKERKEVQQIPSAETRSAGPNLQQ
jgi:hypothetical protein